LFDYILTGSSGLIGRHVFDYLLSKQYSVCPVDLDLGHDLTDEAFVRHFFRENKSKNLVNLYGIDSKFIGDTYKSSFMDIDLGDFNKVLNLNVTSLFSVNREFIRNNLGGSIVNMASIYGVVSPLPTLYNGGEKPVDYGVSKAAVIQMSKHLAVHAAPNFRINTIVLGGVLSTQDSRFIDTYSSRVPMNRLADVSEVAGTVEYLTSNNSSYVTGTTIVVDGGWTAI